MMTLILRGAIALALLSVTAAGAMAQKAPPTPFTGLPKTPGSFPLLSHPTNDGQVLAAATAGDADKIDWLMADGGDVDEADKDGHTPLMRAAMANFTAVANTLIQHAARLDLRDRLGDTALHWAAQTGSNSVMRILIAVKAPLDLQDTHGMTPLMLAAANNKPDTVRLLLEAHADPRKTDYTGRTALSWADPYPRVVSILTTMTAAR